MIKFISTGFEIIWKCCGCGVGAWWNLSEICKPKHILNPLRSVLAYTRRCFPLQWMSSTDCLAMLAAYIYANPSESTGYYDNALFRPRILDCLGLRLCFTGAAIKTNCISGRMNCSEGSKMRFPLACSLLECILSRHKVDNEILLISGGIAQLVEFVA